MPETSQERATPRRRWPVVLWLAQLLAPLAVGLYGGARLVLGPPLGAILWALVALAAAWAVAVLLVACTARGRAWIDGRRYQIALAMIATAFTLAVCDIALTLTGLVPTIAKLRRSSVRYTTSVSTATQLVPNQVVERPGEPLVVSPRGFREPDVVTPKPAGTARLLFLGGSQVFDAHHGSGRHWPQLAAEQLSSPGQPVDVINAAVPGHRTADSIGKLCTELWMLEPDVIVVCQAYNDIWQYFFSHIGPERPYRDLVRPYPGDFRIDPRGLDWLLCTSALYREGRARLLEGKLTQLDVIWGDPVYKRRSTGRISQWAVRQYRFNLEVLCDIGRTIGADVVLVKQARLPTHHPTQAQRRLIDYREMDCAPHEQVVSAFEVCDRVVDEVADKKQCPVIDLNAPLSGKPDYFLDHVHFSEDGSRRAASMIADALRSIMQDGRKRPRPGS